MPFCPFCKHPLAFVEKVCPKCQNDVPKPDTHLPDNSPANEDSSQSGKTARRPQIEAPPEQPAGPSFDNPPFQSAPPSTAKTLARKAIVLDANPAPPEPPAQPTPPMAPNEPTVPPSSSKTTPRKAVSPDPEPPSAQPSIHERLKAIFEANKREESDQPIHPEPENPHKPEPEHRFAGLRKVGGAPPPGAGAPATPPHTPVKPHAPVGIPYISISRSLLPSNYEPTPPKTSQIRKFQLVVEDKFGTTLHIFKLREGKNRVGVYSADFGMPEVDFTSLDNDHVISRRQAEIIIEQGKILIHDLGSRNGTIIRGEKHKGGSAVPVEEDEQLIFANQICRIVGML